MPISNPFAPTDTLIYVVDLSKKQAHPETGSVGHTHTWPVDRGTVKKAPSSTIPTRGDRETIPIQD